MKRNLLVTTVFAVLSMAILWLVMASGAVNRLMPHFPPVPASQGVSLGRHEHPAQGSPAGHTEPPSSPAAAGSSRSGAATPTGGDIAAREEQLPEPDFYRRIELLTTDFKYALLRRETVFRRDPVTGEEQTHTIKRMVGDHIVIRLRHGRSRKDLAELTRKLGGRIRKELLLAGTYLVEFPGADIDTVPSHVAAYAKEQIVKFAEPDHFYKVCETIPNDALFGTLWGMKNGADRDVDATDAWDASVGSRSTVVGIVDTGIDYNHEDLASNVWVNPGEIPGNGIDDDSNGFVDDIHGWDFVNDDADPADDHSHGTHVAGTIGAVGNNGIGVAGVNWRVLMIAAKAFSADGYGADSDIINAVSYVTMMRTNGVNVRVTNNSYGDTSFGQALYDAVAASRDAGMLFMAAAGNGGADGIGDNNEETPHYPSSFDLDNVIAVASTDSSDNRSGFSNYGATSVDLGAPGSGIKSTIPGGYGDKYGTSMATPHVAGAAALLWDMARNLEYDDVRDALLGGVDPVAALGGITVTGGRLNIAGMMLSVPPDIVHVPRTNTVNDTPYYYIDAAITPDSFLLDTNQVMVLWNTNGATDSFQTNVMADMGEDTYRGAIPTQAVGTTVHYYIHAANTNGVAATHPLGAPAPLHSFRIVEPVVLLVGFLQGMYGDPDPGYGLWHFPSGVTVNASVAAATPPQNGQRYRNNGWVGGGDVPNSGHTNLLTFTITRTSSLTWLWEPQYSLVQTSTVPGIVDITTWWDTNRVAQTATAPESMTLGGTNYYFAGWHVDGERQPDPTNIAVNPATGLLMSTSRLGGARYLPGDHDGDGDGIGDWWELLYFGTTAVSAFGDPDNDGFWNVVEHRDRSDPFDPASIPHPPVVQTHALSDPQPWPAPFTISATVTDSYRVASATLNWARNYGGYTDTPMQTGAVADVYSAAIPAPGTNGDHFSYFIYARDGAGQETWSPVCAFDVAYPIMDITPAALADTYVRANSTTSRTVTIANNGHAPLEWHMPLSFQDDMEGGTNGWIVSGSKSAWHVAGHRWVSATQAWHLGSGPGGTYAYSSQAELTTPSVHLWRNPRLSFWHWIETELYSAKPGYAWDAGIVEVSLDGTNFQQITPVGGYPYSVENWQAPQFPQNTPCFAGTGGWQHVEFDLSTYADSDVVIRFHFAGDDNTEFEGWYVDDIVLSSSLASNSWYAFTATNGVVPPAETVDVDILFDTTGIRTGERDAVAVVVGNGPVVAPVYVPFSISVRSGPTVQLVGATQSSTNGEGHVSLDIKLSDADGDSADIGICFSVDSGVTWTSAWVQSVQASLGDPMVSNNQEFAVADAPTTNGSALDTNLISIVWATMDGPAPIDLETNVLISVRGRDDVFWGTTDTSSVIVVDNESPSVPSPLLVTSHAVAVWSPDTQLAFHWGASSDGDGAGVAAYSYFLKTNGGTEAWTGTTTGLHAQTATPADSSNLWVGLCAVDDFGNRSATNENGPFWIDGTGPDASSADVDLARDLFGNYVLGGAITGAWSGFADNLSGIAGYYYSAENGEGTTNGTWTTGTEGILNSVVADETNMFYVWAEDIAGGIGNAAYAARLVLDPEGDYDLDGFSSGDESIAGTDAADPASRFGFESVNTVILLGSNTLVLEWPAITNRLYMLQTAPNMTGAPWVVMAILTNVPGYNGPMCYTDVVDGVQFRFYRVGVSPP